MILRAPTPSDAPALAALVAALGYPSADEEIERRRVMLMRRDDVLLRVAAESGGELLGMVNAERRLTIASGMQFEITSLVVSPHARRRGVGAMLVAAAETWALSLGASALRVRSDVVRPEAHAFYASCGYQVRKTQHCYQRALAQP